MEKESKFTIGLIGNPNTGKSTLFNLLTGARQHVGNWPGKTVEKKEGNFNYKDKKIHIVDLPGSYNLTAYSEEEKVTTNFIFEEKPSVIIQILDAQNLERNLLMAIQLIELRAPLVLALNMEDLAKKNGIQIDIKALSILLNIPVILINAKNKKGIDILIETACKQANKSSKIKITYGTEISNELKKIKDFIYINERRLQLQNFDWIALKLLEGDTKIEQDFSKKDYYLELKSFVKKSVSHLEKIFDKNIHSILTSIRYAFIKGLSKEVIKKDTFQKKQNISDKIDTILMNKYLGIPLFLCIIWLMFQITFTFSAPLIGVIESLFGFLGEYTLSILTLWKFPEWSISLIVDGIIGGVGGVLTFVPIIGILFLIMATLEDSGYMARIAYIMDKLMNKIGLHGKAFIPLILGFGCNVPAIMATRTLENKNDRLLSILINPFMSCGARLPVYILFVSAFFTAYQGWIIFSLYFLGIIIAILVGLLFKKIFSKGLSTPFVIELPPYRWPVMIGLLIHAWEKVWAFIKKAGTIILAFSIISWSLASFPMGVEYGSQESYAGQMGTVISPVFEPLGFGNWESSVALVFGFVAKEVIVGTFGTLYGIENTEIPNETISLTESLQNDFTPLSAYSFMVFVLLYIPCMAVLAVVKKETHSWKWPMFMVLYTTGIAWVMAFLVYQGGLLFGFN
jgi:ferrous iron transport protein B